MDGSKFKVKQTIKDGSKLKAKTTNNDFIVVLSIINKENFYESLKEIQLRNNKQV